jgi:hypothetical protein
MRADGRRKDPIKQIKREKLELCSAPCLEGRSIYRRYSEAAEAAAHD